MRRVILVLALAVLIAGSAGSQESPTIVFTENGLTVSGISNAVAITGIWKEKRGAMPSDGRFDFIVPDDDGDGVVTVSFGRKAPSHALWFATDLTTGSFTVASPTPIMLQNLLELEHGVMGNGAGVVARVLMKDRGRLDVSLVRPGVGSWKLGVDDGGMFDDDQISNGSMSVALERLAPVCDSPSAPNHFLPGDVVVLVDPTTMEYHAATFSAGN